MRHLASLAAPLAIAALLVGCSAHSAAPSAPTTASQSQGVSPVVAIVGGQSITLAELDKKAGQELYDLREHTLDQLIVERVVEKESKAAGKTSDEYLRTLVEAKVPEVSEKEASEFYAKNQDRLGDQFKGVKFDEVKPIIVKGLTSEKRKVRSRGSSRTSRPRTASR